VKKSEKPKETVKSSLKQSLTFGLLWFLKPEKEAPQLLCCNTVTAITGGKKRYWLVVVRKVRMVVYHTGEPFKNSC